MKDKYGRTSGLEAHFFFLYCIIVLNFIIKLKINVMEVNKIKQSQREHEQLVYQREMFWHEPEKQNLIKELLQKIYDLQDKFELLKLEENKFCECDPNRNIETSTYLVCKKCDKKL